MDAVPNNNNEEAPEAPEPIRSDPDNVARLLGRLTSRGTSTRGHLTASQLAADAALLGMTRRPAQGSITAFPPGRPPVTEFSPSSNLARGIGPDVHGTRGASLRMGLGTPDHFLVDPGTGTLAGRPPSRGRPGVPFEEGSPVYEGPGSVTGRSGPAFGIHGRPPVNVVEAQWDVIGTPAAVELDSQGRPRSYASRRPGDVGDLHGLAPHEIEAIETHTALQAMWEHAQSDAGGDVVGSSDVRAVSRGDQARLDKEEEERLSIAGPVTVRRVDPREIDTVEPMIPARPPSARELAERELLRTAVETGREIDARRYEADIKRGMVSKREEAKKKEAKKKEAKKKDSTKNK